MGFLIDAKGKGAGKDAFLEGLEKIRKASADQAERAAAQRAEEAHNRQRELLNEERYEFGRIMTELNGQFLQAYSDMLVGFQQQQATLMDSFIRAFTREPTQRTPFSPLYPRNSQSPYPASKQ